MHFFLILTFLILVSFLGFLALKFAKQKIRFFFVVSAITILVIPIMLTISRHYKEMHPSALIILLFIAFLLVMFFAIRRFI